MIGRAIVELFLPGKVPASGQISARTQLSLPKKAGGHIRPDLSVCVADHALQLLVEVKIDAPIHTIADYDGAPQPDAYRQAWKQLRPSDVAVRAVGTLTVNAAEHEQPDPDNLIALDVTWDELGERLDALLGNGAVEAGCELVVSSLVQAIKTQISPGHPSPAEVQAFIERGRPLLDSVRDALVHRIPGAGPTKPIKGKDYAGSRITLPSATPAPLYLSLALAAAGSSANPIGEPDALIAWPERDTNGNLEPAETHFVEHAGFSKTWTHGGWAHHARAWPLDDAEAVSDLQPICDEIAAMLADTGLIARLSGALSNPQVASRLEAAARVYGRLARQGLGRELPKRPQLRLPMGAIQDEVLEVLRQAGGPVSTRDVQAALEHRLGRPISKDTVNSSLSVGARTGSSSFRRIRRGFYVLVNDGPRT